MARPRPRLILAVSLLLALPVTLHAQGRVSGLDQRPLDRRIAALRLQAMLRPPVPRSRINAIDQLPSLPPPVIRLAGRSIHIPLTGPLDLRAGVSWWSTGLRSTATLRIQF